MWTKVALLAGAFACLSSIAVPPNKARASQQLPPAFLSPAGQAAFNAYLASPVGKAFAVEPTGGFGWVAGYERSDTARTEALASCQRANPDKACTIISVDGQSAQ